MAISTSLVSGLSSGFDWKSMIDQLMQVEHKSVDLVDDQKTKYEDQLSEWQSFNTKLLSLKTAAGALKTRRILMYIHPACLRTAVPSMLRIYYRFQRLLWLRKVLTQLKCPPWRPHKNSLPDLSRAPAMP